MLKIGLVGRTNVGKSTLFNKLLGTYRAIVTDISGTTRELLVDEGQIGGIEFQIYDSPGLENFGEEQQFIQKIIDIADILIFVVDRHNNVGPQDEIIADIIFRAGKKDNTFMVVNKLEHKVFGPRIYEYLSERYTLGIELVLPLSAKQGEGLEMVMEEITRRIKLAHPELYGLAGDDQEEDDFEEVLFDEEGNEIVPEDLLPVKAPATIPFVIVGRPNVGKSTLMNSLVGEYVAHVQDKPGTTLDYIKSRLIEGQTTFELYDTAGIRKQAKIVGLERIAYEKTKTLIEYIKPIVVVMIDGTEGVTHRDLTILGEIVEMGCPVVIALNKADTFEDKAYHDMRRIKMSLGEHSRITVCTISGKEKTGLTNFLQTIRRTWKLAHERIDTPKLNDILKSARIQSPPRFPNNNICKRKYITQTKMKPTTFMMSVNNKDYANFSFIRRCENVIRKEFGMQGIPFKFNFVGKGDKNPFAHQHKPDPRKDR